MKKGLTDGVTNYHHSNVYSAVEIVTVVAQVTYWRQKPEVNPDEDFR